MKSNLNKEERMKRNELIRNLYKQGKSVRQIQLQFQFKSPKSVYAILFPEKHNKYQRDRYLLKVGIK